MRRLFALLPLLLLANGAAVQGFRLAEPLDLRWLATHCTALPEAERAGLAGLVLVDHAVFDVDYWYARPQGQGFHAVRSGLSKALCIGGVGCLTAPVVEGDCLAEA